MNPNLEELIDPRPHDGNRLSYCGMTMLPVAFECEWMKYNEVFQCAVVKELGELLAGMSAPSLREQREPGCSSRCDPGGHNRRPEK